MGDENQDFSVLSDVDLQKLHAVLTKSPEAAHVSDEDLQRIHDRLSGGPSAGPASSIEKMVEPVTNTLQKVGHAIEPYEQEPARAGIMAYIDKIKEGMPPEVALLHYGAAAAGQLKNTLFDKEKTPPPSKKDITNAMGLTDEPIISEDTANKLRDYLSESQRKHGIAKSVIDAASKAKRSEANDIVNALIDLAPGPISAVVPAISGASEAVKGSGVIEAAGKAINALNDASYTTEAVTNLVKNSNALRTAANAGKIPIAFVKDLAQLSGMPVTQTGNALFFAAARMADSPEGKKIIENFVNAKDSGNKDAVEQRFLKRK